MSVDSIFGEGLFEALIEATIKDAAAFMLPGSSLASVLMARCGSALWSQLRGKPTAQQQEDITALSKVSFKKARDIATALVRKKNLDPEQESEIINYLSAIPMTARRAMGQRGDMDNATALLSQIPRSEADVSRFVPIRPPHYQPGEKIPGHDYELETLLGQGGFAEVWKARHTVQDSKPAVALKFCLDDKLIKSLKTEIEVLDVLDPYAGEKDFVQLLGTAYSAEPPFLIYEYIDGGDLLGWLNALDGKRPSPKEVTKILVMAARAVAVAHDHKIVHRDLKPANLLLTREGRIKVSDFGIGSILADAESRNLHTAGLTGATFLRGAHTPLYADPRAVHEERIDAGVDVYALGVIGYQLLVGDCARTMGPAWRDELNEFNVPTALAETIGTCVAVPKKRFRNAGALLAALEKLNEAGEDKKSSVRDPDQRDTKKAKRTAKSTPTTTKNVTEYCIECGIRISTADRFCNNCGKSLR